MKWWKKNKELKYIGYLSNYKFISKVKDPVRKQSRLSEDADDLINWNIVFNDIQIPIQPILKSVERPVEEELRKKFFNQR